MGNHTWRKKLTKIMTATMVLGLMAPPILETTGIIRDQVVYADEVEDSGSLSDEDKLSNLKEENEQQLKDGLTGAGNIYTLKDSAFAESALNAAKYNTSMQYAMTYAILSEGFGKTANYGGIYTGNFTGMATAFDGMGTALAPISKYGGSNFASDLGALVDVGVGTNGGIGEDTQKEIEQNNKEAEEIQKEKEEIIERISGELADITIDYLYAARAGQVVYDKNLLEEVQNVWNGVFGTEFKVDSFSYIAETFTRIDKGKEVSVDKSNMQVLKPKIKDKIKVALSSETFEGKKLSDVKAFSSDGLKSLLTDVDLDYLKGKGMTYSPDHKGMLAIATSNKDGGLKPHEVSDAILYTQVSDEQTLRKGVNSFESGFRVWDAYVIEAGLQGVTKYLKDRGNKGVTTYLETKDKAYNDTFKKKVNALGDKYKDDLDQLKKIAGKEKDKVNVGLVTDYNLSMYIPLGVQVNLGTLSKKDFEKQLGDDLSLSSNMITSKDGYRRNLQVQDMFYMGKESTILFAPKLDEVTTELTLGNSQKLGGRTLNSYVGKRKDSANGEYKTREVTNKEDAYTNVWRKYSSNGDAKKSSELSGFNVSVNGNTNSVSMDNYGNVIENMTGKVLIPYWSNSLVDNFTKDSKIKWNFGVTPLLGVLGTKELKNGGDLNTALNANPIWERVAFTSDSKMLTTLREEGYIVSESDYKDAFNTISASISGENNLAGVNSILTGEGATGEVDSKVIQLLAAYITYTTTADVKAYNEKMFIPVAKDQKYGFIELGSGGNAAQSDELAKGAYSLADIINAFGEMLLDVGFGEVIRMSLGGLLNAFYNSNFVAYAENAIFNTPSVMDTSIYQDYFLRIWVIVLILAVVFLAILIAIKKYRGAPGFTSVGDILKKFAYYGLLMYIPFGAVYVFHTVINDIPGTVVKTQLKKQSEVDLWRNLESERQELDTVYRKYFSRYTSDVDDVMKKTYVMRFYTTTTKDGVNIEENQQNNLTGSALKEWDKYRNKGYDYKKADLGYVDVSLFDVAAWLQMRTDNNGGDTTLFQFLDSDNEKLINKGSYEGVSNYKEYHIDTNKYFSDKDNGGRQSTTNGYKALTASDLLLEMWKTAKVGSEGAQMLSGLYKVEQAVNGKTGEKERPKLSNGEEISQKDIESLIRDLASPIETRKVFYGTEDADKAFSQSTLELMKLYDISKPATDVFGMSNIVTKLNPYRGYGDKNLQKDVYDLNRGVLERYINTYSTVRTSSGMENSSTASSGSFDSAEIQTIVLDLFFSTVKQFDLTNFPSSYQPRKIAFDTYMRMSYIPIAEYSNDLLTNTGMEDGTAVNNMTLSEYVSIRENWFNIIIFGIAVVFVAAYGTFMLVFYGGGFLLAAIWSAIGMLRKDEDGKNAWKGTTFMLIVGGITKLGLFTLLYLFNTVGDWMYRVWGGSTLPTVFIYSLILILYMVAVFKYAIMPMIKALRDDPVGLGWNTFGPGLKGKLQGALSGVARVIGNVGGSIGIFEQGAGDVWSESLKTASGKNADATKAHSARRAAKKKEGAEAKIEKAERKRMKQAEEKSSNILGKVAKATGGVAAATALASLVNKANGVASYDTALGNVLGKIPKMGSYLVSQDSKQYGKVTDTVSGVDLETIENAEDGMLLSDTAKATQGVLQVDSVFEADRLKNHLRSQGFEVYEDEDEPNLVRFDTKGLDLTKGSVRKELFGGLVDDLSGEVASSKITDLGPQAIQGEFLPYEKKPDGTVRIPVGDSGISPEYLRQLDTSGELEDMFSSVSIPKVGDKYTNGYIEGVANGDVDKLLKGMYRKDSKFRKHSDLADRASSLVDAKQYVGNVEGSLPPLPDGMYFREGNLMYAQGNSEHEKYLAEVKDTVFNKSQLVAGQKAAMLRKLTNNVIGDMNDGYLLEELTTGDESKRVLRYKAEDTKAFVSKVEALKHLGSVEEDKISKYGEASEEVINLGRETLVQGDKGDYLAGIEAINNFINTDEDVSEEVIEEIETYRKEYGKLRKSLKGNNLTNEEFKRKLGNIFLKMEEALETDGKLEDFYSGVAQGSNTDVLNRAVEELRKSKQDIIGEKDLGDIRFTAPKLRVMQGISRKLGDVQVEDATNGVVSCEVSSEVVKDLNELLGA